MTDKEVLADFYNVCGEILMGRAKEEDIKRVTKAMFDTNQQAIMSAEFTKIQETLTGK